MSVRAVTAAPGSAKNQTDAQGKVTVKPGDTLSAIADRIGVTLKDLLAANPQIKDPDKINPGQEILIPRQDSKTSPAADFDDSGKNFTPLQTVLPEAIHDSKTQTCTPSPFSPTAIARGQFLIAQREKTTVELVAKAGQAGVFGFDLPRLGAKLRNLSASEFETQANLVRDALGSGDPQRAMNAYLEIESIRTGNPSRITDDIQRALVMGVGASRTATAAGKSGVLEADSARRAAETLAKMPQSEYDRISGLLAQAGQGTGANRSASTEKALILKAVAARQNQLSHPRFIDAARMGAKMPMIATDEIIHFAKAIRGQTRHTLIENTTVQDLTSSTGGFALKQRFNDSCGPTSGQLTRAEADPIYAWQLQRQFVYGTSTTGYIADQQKEVLTKYDGKAVERGQAGGKGMSGKDAFNEIASGATHRRYTAEKVGNSAEDRKEAMDEMAALLRRGIDVPIRVEWRSGGGHFEVATDVRGYTPDREFLINDPWQGKTGWVKEADIAAGNTDFFAGRGRLAHIYSSVAM